MSADWFDAYQRAVYGGGGFDQDPYAYEDPEVELMRQEVAELRALRESVEQAEQAHEINRQIDALEDTSEAMLDDLGVVTEAQRDAIVRQAIAMDPDPDGRLNIHAAYEALHGANQAETEALEAEFTDDPPPEDGDAEELLQWQMRRMEGLHDADREIQRAAVEAGELDPAEARDLPVWEREGREPALDEDGHPDPTTEEGAAIMAQRLEILNELTGN